MPEERSVKRDPPDTAARLDDGTLSLRRDWSDEEWDRELSRHPAATIFHTRTWARLIRSAFPNVRDRSLWFETAEGPVLLPLFAWERAGGLLTTLHSSFPFLYGGPVPPRAADGRSWTEALLPRFRERWASMRWTGNPFAGSHQVPVHGQEAIPSVPEPVAFIPEGDVPGYARGLETTHLLRLPASEDAYWNDSLTTAKRNDVRRLGKKGVTVEATRREEDVRAVYQLYLDSFGRWGGRPGLVYPPSLYLGLLEQGAGVSDLLVARHRGQVLGGTFLLRWNGKTHYFAGYFDHRERAMRPNVLIQVESILRSIREGCGIYDFLPSGGHGSVEAFKESFGGCRTRFSIYERRGLLHRLLGRSSTIAGGPSEDPSADSDGSETVTPGMRTDRPAG